MGKRKLQLWEPSREIDGTKRTYWSTNKEDWGPGPWKGEPDKIQWIDETTGLDCLLVRNGMGFLCGYVGVGPDHPWYGVDNDDCGMTGPKPEGYEEGWYPAVHGGLTYAAKCHENDDESTGICHVPAPGRSDDIWWLGFDCGHCNDLTILPISAAMIEHCKKFPHGNDIYRDINYVMTECGSLATQAKSVG